MSPPRICPYICHALRSLDCVYLTLQAELAEPLQPGDAVGVLVPNPEAEVTDLCVRLGCDAAAIVTLCANEGGGLPSHLPAEPSTVVRLLTLLVSVCGKQDACDCLSRTHLWYTGGNPVAML